MTKFCSDCGNQMTDNSKFCMGCGAKLGDYTSGRAGIKDSVIQRSQVGTASVGNIHISPIIKIESNNQNRLENQIALEMPEKKSNNKIFTIIFIVFIILVLMWYLTR
jgi:uncharacterized membrane protein YvbJ